MKQLKHITIRPINKTLAKYYCTKHPHAGSLPNSSKYYFAAYNKKQFIGLAVWGWGIVPAQTPKKLFGKETKLTTANYLELCRFFVIDNCEKNTASKFLSFTIKKIKQYDKDIKFLYTYAAGFQGLVGTIYQATGFDYIGTIKCSFLWIENIGLVHTVALYHRYKKINKRIIDQIYPHNKKLNGLNFCYIKFVCSDKEKHKLMKSATFTINKYPTKADLKIWDENKEEISPEVAKKIPIVKLKSKICGSGARRSTLAFQARDGGAVPTEPLHK